MSKDKLSINIQGLSRRDEQQQRCFMADEGHVFIASDMCFPTSTTEFLTRDGWKMEPGISDGEEIWQVNPQTLIGSWVVPKRRVHYDYTGEMVSYPTNRGTLTVTKDHKMLWVGQINHPTRRDKALWRNVTKAGRGDLKSIQHICHFSYGDTISHYSAQELWTVTLLQADGSLEKKTQTPTYKVEVSKPRKRSKITELFGEGMVASEIRPNQTMLNERWRVQYSSRLLKGKTFELSSLGANQADEFVKALSFWDGSVSTHSSRTGRISYVSTDLDSIEQVQSFLVRSGYECRRSEHYPTNPLHKKYYRLSIRKCGVTRWSTSSRTAPSGKTTQSVEVLSKVENLSVSCFEVSDGFLLVRQEGQTFVSGNCAGEPTVLAHYSKDPNYLNATLRMVGKKPYYDKDNMLVISDPYIMVASKYPLWKDEVRQAFESTDYEGGRSGFEQWVTDDNIVKKRIKKIRTNAKALGLMLVYGAGARKLVQVAQQMQFELTIKEAKAFKNLFWGIFPLAKKLGEKLEIQYNSKGVIVNDFGYALYPEEGYKCLNAVIQSSVAGIVDLLSYLFFSKNPEALYCVNVHDEVIFQIPEKKLDYYRRRYYEAVDELNKLLGWGVPIQFGWAESKTFYLEGK